MKKPEIVVSVADGIKCPRCWHYHSVRENYDGLCDRCLRLIAEHWAQDFPEAAANWVAQKARYTAVIQSVREGL